LKERFFVASENRRSAICKFFHTRNITYKTCGCYKRTIHGNNFKKVSVATEEPTLV
jgi:hypothetical protein